MTELIEYPTHIILNSNLLYKTSKTLRELHQIMPRTQENALERYNIKIKSEILNSILNKGDLTVEHWLISAQQKQIKQDLTQQATQALQGEEYE